MAPLESAITMSLGLRCPRALTEPAEQSGIAPARPRTKHTIAASLLRVFKAGRVEFVGSGRFSSFMVLLRSSSSQFGDERLRVIRPSLTTQAVAKSCRKVENALRGVPPTTPTPATSEPHPERTPDFSSISSLQKQSVC